jgi:hypothetical protein
MASIRSPVLRDQPSYGDHGQQPFTNSYQALHVHSSVQAPPLISIKEEQQPQHAPPLYSSRHQQHHSGCLIPGSFGLPTQQLHRPPFDAHQGQESHSSHSTLAFANKPYSVDLSRPQQTSATPARLAEFWPLSAQESAHPNIEHLNYPPTDSVIYGLPRPSQAPLRPRDPPFNIDLTMTLQ